MEEIHLQAVGRAGILLKDADPTGMLGQCCEQACKMYGQALEHNNGCMEKAAIRLLVVLLPYNAGGVLGHVVAVGVQKYGDSDGITELIEAIAERDLDWSQNTLKCALSMIDDTKMWFWQKRGLRRKLQSRLNET